MNRRVHGYTRLKSDNSSDPEIDPHGNSLEHDRSASDHVGKASFAVMI
jgi:hypothetical protein